MSLRINMERSPFPMNYSRETCALTYSFLSTGWIYRHPFGTRFKGQRRYDGWDFVLLRAHGQNNTISKSLIGYVCSFIGSSNIYIYSRVDILPFYSVLSHQTHFAFPCVCPVVVGCDDFFFFFRDLDLDLWGKSGFRDHRARPESCLPWSAKWSLTGSSFFQLWTTKRKMWKEGSLSFRSWWMAPGYPVWKCKHLKFFSSLNQCTFENVPMLEDVRWLHVSASVVHTM